MISAWFLCSNDNTPGVFPSSPSFCIWHRLPPGLIIIFFCVFWFRIWGDSIFWGRSWTRSCLMRNWGMEIGWELIRCWGMWRKRWKHWWRVDRNGHSGSWPCCRMGIEKGRRWGLRRGVMGCGGRWRTWTWAVQGPRTRSRSLFDNLRLVSMRKIDFDSDSNYFFASLGEESSFLTFEVIASWAWTHLEIIWWCRWKHGHQVMTSWRCGIFAWWHIRCMAKIQFWKYMRIKKRWMMDFSSPLRLLGDMGRRRATGGGDGRRGGL